MSSSSSPVDNAPYRKWTLIVVTFGSALGAMMELAVVDPIAGDVERLLAYLASGTVSAYQLLRGRHTGLPLAVVAVSFGALSLTPAALGESVDSGITLAAMIVMAVIYVITREGESTWPVLACSLLIAGYTVLLVITEQASPSDATGKLMMGIPGQMLVVWLTWRIILRLEEATRRQTRERRTQEALATCSHALLTGRDPDPLGAALEALLGATEADYVYVDVNRVDAEGNVTWEILTDAYGEAVPSGPDTFDDGDYSQLPRIAERLASGRAARLRVAELPMPIRERYERESIKAELMAPIMMRDQWVGTIGYVDFWRDDQWTEIEEAALTRAADMISAYWERESAREGLEELAKSKDRFIATVSHELRTPLSAVVGFAETLAEGLDKFSTSEIAEMVDLISTQGSEVARLVDDLLTAERAQSGNLTIKSAAIDLVEECRAVLESLRFEVELSIEGDVILAWADTLRTRQIIRNLLTNANRYGGETIRMELRDSEATVTLAVTDSGSGVKGIDAEHIFDPYYRANSNGDRPDSVGLGLAVARQLARMMGGDLVYLRRNGWTCFELTLPSAALVRELTTADWG
ncbi:MAG: HAMP domain-containing histidine kinase [Actinobacteria bacterium]|nr:HAMP domain-containing histidine kinase [Actinomycetota bacterium]MCI0678399.1 HAMP domain-containing histidine kinase [Actinomycetota bacterium]